jgi:hypothetical protein
MGSDLFGNRLLVVDDEPSIGHLVQMVDSTVVRAYVSAAGAKGGGRAKPSGARAAGFPAKSTWRPFSTACRWPSI